MKLDGFYENVRNSLQISKTARLRFFLTTLGISIGVFSITLLLAFVNGLQYAIRKEIESIGKNFIYLQKYPGVLVLNEATINELIKRKDFTIEDWRSLKIHPSVENSAILISKYVPLKYKKQEAKLVNIIGTVPEYEKASNHPLEIGRYINYEDLIRIRPVGVIGHKIASTLFPSMVPIGKEINVEGHTVEIIGVLQKRATFLDPERDNVIIVPYSFYNKIIPKTRLSRTEKIRNTEKILIIPKDGKAEELLKYVEYTMRNRHGLRVNEKNDFEIQTAEELFNFFNNITKIGSFAIVIIAGISLLVGGIGIMNVMLISVGDRIREIGIKKAIGATSKNILWEFLFESVLIALGGGGIGFVVAVILSVMVSLVSPLKPVFAFWIILLALGFSTGVGICFGIYPAQKAARLQPVEALRYE